MSMSTPGPERVPSTVKVDKTSGQGKPPAGGKPGSAKPSGAKPGAAKPGAAKPGTAKPGAAKPGAGKGGKGRKPITPIKVAGSRNWGAIATVGAVILIAVGIIGYGVFASINGPKTWADKAAAISGITDFRKSDPDLVKGSQHQQGAIKYAQSPPVAGPHNPVWQNCNGNVYDAQIANENAVHALEHGSVWITYKPGLAADQVAKLAGKVTGTEKMLMSPYPGLDTNISLQAWGYQLKVDNADDSRIDDFIRALRVNASVEGPTAACDGGVTSTGTTPQGTAGGTSGQ